MMLGVSETLKAVGSMAVDTQPNRW